MKVTIYHNPRCSKSRQALALIRRAGHQPHIIAYLQTPPDAATLLDLCQRVGVGARAMMRCGEDIYKDLDLAAVHDEVVLVQAMVDNPILLQRPVIVTERGAVIARPPERVHEVLA